VAGDGERGLRPRRQGWFFLSFFVLAGSAPSLSLSLSFSLFLSQPRPFFESCINKHTQKQSGAAFAVRAATPEDEAALARVLDACSCCCSSSGAGGGGGEEGNRIVAKDAFERKTDAGSAELYFHCTFSLSFLDENDARFSLPPFSLDQKNKSKHPQQKQTTACSSTSKICSRTTCGREPTGPRSTKIP